MSAKITKASHHSERHATHSPRPSNRHGDTTELHCKCKLPYDSRRWMICCDRCNRWFHGSCINIPEEAGPLAVYFYCQDCSDKYGLQSVWQRKCRLESCWNPARVENHQSKYCSDEHGMQFFTQSVKSLRGITPQEIGALVHSADALKGVATLRSAEKEASAPPAPEPVVTPVISDEDRARVQAIDNELKTLERVKTRISELSAEQARETGKKVELCGYSEHWREDESLPDMCTGHAQKCLLHSLWALVAERRLNLEKNRLLHNDTVQEQTEVQIGPIGVTRYSREGKAFFKAL